MDSVKKILTTALAAVLITASVRAAGEYGPIRGTLGQRSREPAKAVVPEKPPQQQPATPLSEEEIENAINSLPPLYEMKNDFFQIFSEDLTAMRKTGEIAARLESRAKSLNWKNPEKAAAAEIWISPSKDSEKIREIKQSITKNWRCAFLKNPETLDDYETAYILAETLVRQCAKNNIIAFPQDNPPKWLVSSLADEALIGTSAGKLRLFKQEIDGMTPMDFEKLTEETAGTETQEFPDMNFRGNAFLLGKAVKKELPAFLADPRGTLKSLVKNAATDNLRTLWTAQFYAAKTKIPAGAETLEKSRERYAEMLTFSITVNGRETRVAAEHILPLVSQESTKLLIYRRLAEIANALPQTNPVWHNAFTELAAYYEMLSKPEPTAKLPANSPWAADRSKLFKAHQSKIENQWQKAVAARELAEKQSDEISAIINPVPEK